jgi:hypothetical protein
MTEPNEDRRSQSARILIALKQGPLTPMDALREFGCFRLAARVLDLRQAGYTIVSEKVEANGKRFAQYRLVQREAA